MSQNCMFSKLALLTACSAPVFLRSLFRAKSYGNGRLVKSIKAPPTFIDFYKPETTLPPRWFQLNKDKTNTKMFVLN